MDVAQAPAVKGLDKRVGELEADLDSLEGYVFQWTETAQTYLLAIRRVIEERFELDMRSYLDLVAEETDTDEDGADHEKMG